MITTLTKTITRTAVDTWLRTVRVPVDAVVRATGADAAVIDRADVAVRRAVAGFTGDDELLASARRREAAIDLRDVATEKAAEAERLQHEADVRRREADAEARRAAQEAEARAAQVTEERRRRKAQEQQAQAAVADRDRRAAAARKRQADKRRLAAEAQAVTAAEKAAAAEVREAQLAEAERTLGRR